MIGCYTEDLLHQIFSKDLLLYAFQPQRTLYAEFRQALKGDEAYQRDKTLFNGFLMICKWQQGPSESTRDSKKSKGNQALRAVQMTASVEEHCEDW